MGVPNTGSEVAPHLDPPPQWGEELAESDPRSKELSDYETAAMPCLYAGWVAKVH